MPPKSVKRKPLSPPLARMRDPRLGPSHIGSNAEEQDMGALTDEEVAPPLYGEAAVVNVKEEEAAKEREDGVGDVEREEMNTGDETEKINSSEVVNIKEEVTEEEREKNQSEIKEEAAHPEPNSCEEVAVATQIDGSEILGNGIKGPVLNKDTEEDPEDDPEEDPEDDPEEDPEEVKNSSNNNGKDTEHEEFPLPGVDRVTSDKNKDKNPELFVARLTTQTMEEDLIKVFEQFGQIKSARVMRNKTTNRSKRCAFVQYATAEQAESAVAASEAAGIEVRGKRVSVSMSNDDNNTLYLCNICKLWTKEQVLETLKNIGIDYVEKVCLPSDPHEEGQIRGYAFLEFNTHLDAISAFERLSMPNAIFGLNESAKVSFAGTPIHPSEDVLSQGKTVYVEGLPDKWTEAKIREFCEHYGVVEDIRLSRTLRKKSKNYGYITFATEDIANACLEGFKNACSGGMFKASIARFSICQPHEQELHGGFKVTKEGEVPKEEEESKRENRNESSNVDDKEISNGAKAGGFDRSNENRNFRKTYRGQSSSRRENPYEKRKSKNMKAAMRRLSRQGKIPENLRGEKQRNQSSSFGKGRRDRDSRYRKGPGPGRNVDFGTYKSQFATERGGPAVQYEGRTYFAMSGSKRPRADMDLGGFDVRNLPLVCREAVSNGRIRDPSEPHGGYFDPAARKQGRGPPGPYGPPVPMHYPPHAGTQYHPHVGHPQSEIGTYQYPHAVYQNVPAQARYVDPTLGVHTQPHAGYVQPTAVNSSHNMGSGGMQDPHGAAPSAYGAAGSSIPPSHPPYYPNNVGYEAGSSGGGYYPSTEGTQPWPGTYY